ncbi:MAG: hypothetical protein AB7E72_00540 [Lysobacterales bacterium]
MSIIGHLCLLLAVLVYLIPWLGLQLGQARGSDTGAGLLWSSVWLGLPLGALLTGAWMVVVTRGGMDWLARDRGLQYVAILSAGLGFTVVVTMASALRLEPSSQIPWAMRLLVPWAAWALPAAMMVAAALALNGPSHVAVQAGVRTIWLITTALSALVAVGLLMELGQSQRVRQREQLQQQSEEQDQRDRQTHDEVARMRLPEDLSQLLNHSNVYENPEVRALALQKLAEHPDLTAAVAEELTRGRAYEAIIYLQGNDPPHPEQLDQAIAIGIDRIAAGLASDIQRTHTLYAEQGETETLRILDVLKRYPRGQGDYRPAMRRLRAALDDPRPNQVPLKARALLDRWLAAHPD